MTWQSGDESVAHRQRNRKPLHRAWDGRRPLQADRRYPDGGYTVTVYADVGSLTHAAVITAFGLRDGKPYVVVQNLSGMELTQVRFRIRGYDERSRPFPSARATRVRAERRGQRGARRGRKQAAEDTVLYHAADCTGLAALQACVTGWTTTTGFYDANGSAEELQPSPSAGMVAWPLRDDRAAFE
jgi:hypothetical protein